MKKCSNAYQADKRYAGVRRKSLGYLGGALVKTSLILFSTGINSPEKW